MFYILYRKSSLQALSTNKSFTASCTNVLSMVAYSVSFSVSNAQKLVLFIAQHTRCIFLWDVRTNFPSIIFWERHEGGTEILQKQTSLFFFFWVSFMLFFGYLLQVSSMYVAEVNNEASCFRILVRWIRFDSVGQGSATYGMRAKRGTRNDFQWHAEWIEI